MTTNHVSVRLDAATLARVDAVSPRFSTEWRAATRSDILRGLILDALDRIEHVEHIERGGGPGTEKAGAGARKPKRVAKPKR